MTSSIIRSGAGVALSLALVVAPASAWAGKVSAAPIAAGEVVELEIVVDVEDLILGGPVTAEQGAQGQDLGKWSNYAEPGDLVAVPPAGPGGDSPNRDRAGRALLSVASAVGSIAYFPIKLVIGTAGAFFGGVAGALSGGDQATAAGIWNVTTDGDYFVSPEEIAGDREFRMTGDHR
ncbi:MAG: hypothetical protein VCC00_13520 [Deltaproteobacteria bacterium]